MANTLQNASTGGRSFTAQAVEFRPGQPLTAPSAPVPTTATTGGTILAGTYGVKVSLVTAQGECLASVAGTVTTTGTTSTITVPSPAAASNNGTTATGWYAYVTAVGGSTYYRQQAAGSPTPIGTALTLTAPPTTTGANPPTVDTSNGVPGVAVAPTGYVAGKGNQVEFNYNRMKESVASNTRYAGRINVPTIGVASGNLDLLLNPTMGLEYWEGLTGAQAQVASVAAVQTTGGITTSNGVSTIPVTGSFVVGAPVLVNTTSGGLTQAATECTVVQAYTPGTLTVPALGTNAAAVTGTYIVQPGVDANHGRGVLKFANSLLPAAYQNQMPLLTKERNIAGNWSRRFRSVLVEKGDITFSNTGIAVQFGLFGTQKPDYLNLTGSGSAVGAFSPYNPTTADENVAINHPFTTLNSFFVTPGDPRATGSSALQAAIGVLGAKISLDNGLKKFEVLGNATQQAIPGDTAKLDIEWTALDTAYRADILDDYIVFNNGTAFLAYVVENIGTAANPIFRFMSFYAPWIIFETQTINDKIGDTAQSVNKASGIVQRGSVQDLLQVFAW